MPVLPSNLHLASNTAITAALSNLRLTYNGRNAWLDPAANKYIVDPIEEIKRDITASTLNSAHITDYMATSVLIHCFNGWTYLSNAVNSLLEGDFGNAIHNAYYAELRSIFSILGSQGIGVYNRNNVLIDQYGAAHQVTPINKATHVFAKDAFDEWLNNPSNRQTILSLFTVEGSSLQEWVLHSGLSSELSGELAAAKLKQWSLDVAVIHNEQKFRNYVSYNPLRFNMAPPAMADNIENRLRFTTDLWKLCAPDQLFSYSILRNTYENLYRTMDFALTDLDMKADWERLFTDIGKNVNDAQSQTLIRFLKREINTNDNLVFHYADTINVSSPIIEQDIEPFGIISRACIMLLLNTKIIESVLRQSGTSKNDLKFWFDNIGLKSGLWNTATEPIAFADLWADVELDIEDISSWINDPAITSDPFTYKNDLKGSTSHIRNFAKAYLWNSGL